MVKKLIYLAVCFLIVSNSFGQLSISIDNKFGFNMLGTYGPLGYGNSNSNSNSTTYTSKKFCFGSGYQGGIDLRYGFKKGIGINVGGAYLMGMKNETTSKSNSGGSMPYSYDDKNEIKARLFRINIGGSYIGEGKISPVVKMGIVMGMGKVLTSGKSVSTSSQYSYNPNPPYNSYTVTTTTTYEDESKFYGGISWGFSSALGLNYRVNDNFSVSLCLDVVVQEFVPKKAIQTKSTKDGVDQLVNKLKSEKETEFVKEYTDVGGPPNNVAASKAPKISLPVSSFGPSFGLTFIIGKKKEASSSETKQQ